jgi:hypothetical protein
MCSLFEIKKACFPFFIQNIMDYALFLPTSQGVYLSNSRIKGKHIAKIIREPKYGLICKMRDMTGIINL